MEQILSQDEVDALLKGISGGEIEEPEEHFEEEEREYRTYDFTRQERIVQVRMPAIDAINDVFLRSIRSSISGALRRILDITAVPMELERFGAFVRTLPVPSSLQIFKMEPFRGHALFVIEPKLVFALVESFLGGTGARNVRIEGRDFTGIEQRLIQRIVNLLLADLEKAWNSLHRIQVQYVRSEINPQFAKICEPTDVVIINRYEIDMDRAVGSVTLCIPIANLESVKQKLMTTFQREQSEEDIKLKNVLTENIKNVPVKINVELGKTVIPAGDIIQLEKGDIIQLDTRKDELLPVFLAGVRKYMGSPGLHRGNKALLIKRKVIDQDKD
ncbi:MAG: flagellar motor switch protein FliM [Desulfobulbaceae bacterium]|uniref:Flagellar motor switch protein FliM n=1 Tax=Candidatus Desulfobia pelagia TaxID=2841692 RepID=A0A8J6NAY5_9BACT|nr:flagellar motor switch protein FliM [Candidatus Desulfobia pelagia]